MQSGSIPYARPGNLSNPALRGPSRQTSAANSYGKRTTSNPGYSRAGTNDPNEAAMIINENPAGINKEKMISPGSQDPPSA